MRKINAINGARLPGYVCNRCVKSLASLRIASLRRDGTVLMFDSGEWTTQFERLLPSLQGPDSIRARTAAQSFAQQFGDDSYLDVRVVRKAAQALPAIGARHMGSGIFLPGQPQVRDENFDLRMGDFVKAVRFALNARADFETEVNANNDLTREECRELVHRYLGTQREHVFSATIVVATKLSREQVHEALEQLESEGLIANETIKSRPNDGSVSWRTRLNSDGRNLLDGTKPARPQPTYGPITTITHSTLTNSPMGITGTGNVTINTRLPEMPQDLRGAFDADPTALAQVSALEEELRRPIVRGKLLSNLYAGVRTAIESMNLTAETAAHGHEWLTMLHASLNHLLQ